MVSGGARARSGPAPDPNALRRDRANDKDWLTLPVRDELAPVPVWPFSDEVDGESGLWAYLWSKPQAGMWEILGLERQVALYVRTAIRAEEPDVAVTIIPQVLRMEAELGLSTVGMNALRWKFASDEVAAHREDAKPARKSSRDRLKALNA